MENVVIVTATCWWWYYDSDLLVMLSQQVFLNVVIDKMSWYSMAYRPFPIYTLLMSGNTMCDL